MAVKHLDTKDFDSMVTKMRGYINDFTEIKNHFNKTARELLEHWEGKGRNAFQTDYTEVQLNLEDLTDIKVNNLYKANHGYYEYRYRFLPIALGVLGGAAVIAAGAVVLRKVWKKRKGKC